MATRIRTIDWRRTLAKNDKDATIKNMSNMMQFMRHCDGLGDNIRYNELTGLIEFKGVVLKDEDYVEMRMIIEREGLVPAELDVIRACAAYALENKFHPIRDYLEGLKWDGRARLDIWLKRVFGAPDKPLISAMGRKFMVAAAKRIYEPGCKFDYMLVLEGAQGIGKTSAVNALFGEEYTTSDLHEFKGKQAAESIQGMWVAEIGELAALGKSDVRDSKKFITNTIDRYRPSYGKNNVFRPRVTVFIGTTNDDRYLLDPTGGRRYWPVPCTKVDIKALKAFRAQMWAEAVHLYKQGEATWLDDPELTKEITTEQEARYAGDVWETAIDNYLAKPEVRMQGFVRVADIMFQALSIETGRMAKNDEMRVSNHLKNSGFLRDQRWNPNLRKPEKVWLFPQNQPESQ